MPFEPVILEGGKGGNFVCTFCAGTFPIRADLNEHWLVDPRCKANKYISNATQTKYGDAEAAPAVHGEETLMKIRAATCTHESWTLLRAEGGLVIGRQCNYCYTQEFGLWFEQPEPSEE